MHGFVCIKKDGAEVFRRGGFQHNMNLRSGGAYDEEAVAELVEAVKKLVAAAA